jgi:hypothetical protein
VGLRRVVSCVCFAEILFRVGLVFISIPTELFRYRSSIASEIFKAASKSAICSRLNFLMCIHFSTTRGIHTEPSSLAFYANGLVAV